MDERLLSPEETTEIYNKINVMKIKPFDNHYSGDSSELYYELDGKKYRLIYTPDLDWFCDIAYEGDYYYE